MKLITTILVGLISSYSIAGELPQRTYTFKVDGRFLKCTEGIPLELHNFPLPTTIKMDTEYGAYGVYSSSKISLQNTTEVVFNDRSGEPCSNHAKLLSGQGMNGTATMNYTTTVSRTGTGECYKTIREDLTMLIEGYKFSGYHETYLPMANKDCKTK